MKDLIKYGVAAAVVIVVIAVIMIQGLGIFKEPRIIKQGYLVNVSHLNSGFMTSGSTILEFKDGSTFTVGRIANTPRIGMIRIICNGIFHKIEAF